MNTNIYIIIIVVVVLVILGLYWVPLFPSGNARRNTLPNMALNMITP